MRNMKRVYMFAALIILMGVVAWRVVPAASFSQTQADAQNNVTTTTPIKHVVVIMMENRTFDHMFGLFPGANGYTENRAPNPTFDFEHNGPSALAAIDGGKLDEYPARGYVQLTQADIPNYWAYAQHYGLSDNFFTSSIGDSTPNHMAWVAAQTGGLWDSAAEDGCYSGQNDLIYSRSASAQNYWQYPCLPINSLPTLLDKAGITWKYYTQEGIWNAPHQLQAYYKSPNDIKNPNQFALDVQSGTMAKV